jgi:hypothetical protein
MLRVVRHRRPSLHHDLAAGGLDGAAHQFDQGRLALPVRADQRDSLPDMRAQRHVHQQVGRRPRPAERHLGELQHRHPRISEGRRSVEPHPEGRVSAATAEHGGGAGG